MAQRIQFKAKPSEDPDRFNVFRKTWLEEMVNGEVVVVPTDDYGGDDGYCVGSITENEHGSFSAEYQSSFIDTNGRPTGCTVSVPGLFPTLEDAVVAIESGYDPDKDDLMTVVR